MDAVDLCGKDSGSIWSRKPLPSHKDGLFLRISNTRVGLTSRGRRLQFVRVAISTQGGWFVAADHAGVLYCFNITRNRYHVVYRAGQLCTALACSPTHASIVLMALADGTIHCINIDSGVVVARLSGHESSVKLLSIHSSGQYLLSVSSGNSMLWELADSYTHLRTLSGGETVGVQEVFFVPHSNTILTCFRDDSIHGWEADTQEYKFLLPSPSGPDPHYRAFATTTNGKVLAAAGRSCVLHVWNLERRKLSQVLQLPDKIRYTKQLLFVPNTTDGGPTELLALLAQDGILRLLSLNHCKVVFQLGSDEQALDQAHVDPMGGMVVGVSSNGDLLLYDIAALVRQHTAPLELHTAAESPHPKVSQLSSCSPRTKAKSKKPGPSRALVKHRTVQHKPLPMEDTMKRTLPPEKLKSLLRGQGEYPAKYRSLIWQWLLQLPGNHSAYSTLLEKGTHSAYIELHHQYPIKSRKLLRVLQRSLSTLAHWSSLCAELDYLPGLAFPFVKLFQNNQLVTFELLATLMMNWFSHWFEYFPNPPLNILSMIENLLAHSDPTLLNHLVQLKVTSQLYAWPLLQTLFSEVLTRDDWLKLWDHILSHHPSFLLVSVAAYLSTARQALLHCSSLEDVEWFVSHHNTVNMRSFIEEAYRIWDTTPTSLHPQHLLEEFTPLPHDTYPVFNKYPKFIVDYQVEERQKMRREELDYLRQRQSALELERLTEQRRHEEEAWHRQQEMLREAEQQRNKLVEKEEQKLADQRARLQAMKREARMKELRALDEARRRYLHHQQVLKEDHVAQLDKDIQKKIVQRDIETQAAIEDIELQTLELQAQRALLEQELRQRNDEATYRLRTDHSARQLTQDVERDLLRMNMEEDVEREGVRVRDAQVQLALAQADKEDEELNDEAVLQKDFGGLQDGLGREELVEKHRQQMRESKRLQNTLTHMTNEHTRDQQQSPTHEALDWAKRRMKLDNQEAELLTRVHGVRRKVAQQMMQSTSSFSSN